MRPAAQQARTGRLFKQRWVVEGKDCIFLLIYTHLYMAIYRFYIYGYIEDDDNTQPRL